MKGVERPMISEEELKKAMDLHGDTVYRLALCRTQNPTDAEDVYQDVFLKLFEQPSFHDDEKQKAWLIRVTINCCHDLHRSSWKSKRVPMTEVKEATTEPETDQSVWEEVAQLPEELQVVVHLYYGEGYSTAEIAKMIGIRAATVRTRLHRVRKLLRSQMEDDDYEEGILRETTTDKSAPRVKESSTGTS